MNIVFISTVSFPFGGASSSRTLNLVRLFIAAGNTVHVISKTKSSEDIVLENCTYESIQQNESASNSTVDLFLKTLENYTQNNVVNIVCANANSNIFTALCEFCKSNGIKFIVENCEWYDASNYRLKQYDKEYIANQKMIIDDFKLADGFISISRLLDNHNSSFGKPSIRIPTILDVINTKISEHNYSEKIKLVYTGRPGKSKELLSPILKVLMKNKLVKSHVEFDIYGVNFVQLLRNINYNIFLYMMVCKNIKIYGIVNQKKMNDIIKNSDYQIFIRPYRQSSNAGFPTKLGESMMVGTPVITNLTGDIGLYLVDGLNGIVINGNSVNDVEIGLLRILEMNQKDLDLMRQNARECAEKNFDYRAYVSDIKSFFDRVING